MITPSIITSFITSGFLASDLEHQKDIRDCFQNLHDIFSEHFLGNKNANNFALPVELYIFMEPDFKYLKEELKLPDQTSLADFLSDLSKKTDLLNQTYELLADRFRKLQVTPVAFASFFPEISHTDENRNSHALGAVAGMQHLAQRFNQTDEWNIRAIELVCGSRIEGLGIELDTSEKKDVLISRLIPKEKTVSSLDNLIKGLHKTVAGCDPRNVVPYALELEPGSLFLVNSAQSLIHIAGLLKNRKHIGFNLDFSHYCLAGILEEQRDHSFQLSSPITNSSTFEVFKNRIVHAHISDSSNKGHLGDLPLGTFHYHIDYFRNQIQFLANLISTKTGGLNYSNHLSMELEAVGSWKEIKDSFQTLCVLCKLVNAAE